MVICLLSHSLQNTFTFIIIFNYRQHWDLSKTENKFTSRLSMSTLRLRDIEELAPNYTILSLKAKRDSTKVFFCFF